MPTNPYQAPEPAPSPPPVRPRKGSRQHDRKITNRWLTVVALLVAAGALSFFAEMTIAPGFAAIGSLCWLLLFPTSCIACLYWARAIGRSPVMGAFVGFFLPLLCFLIFTVLESGTSGTTAKVKRGETAGLEQCPNCKKHYDRSEYRSDLTEILCSFCKHPLPPG